MANRILLAEDDRATRESLARALELEGYRVRAVADGSAAARPAAPAAAPAGARPAGPGCSGSATAARCPGCCRRR